MALSGGRGLSLVNHALIGCALMSYMMINLAQVSPPRQQVRIDGIQEDYPSSWAGGTLSEFGKSVPNQGPAELGGVRYSVWEVLPEINGKPSRSMYCWKLLKLWETEPPTPAAVCLTLSPQVNYRKRKQWHLQFPPPSLVRGKTLFRLDVIAAVWSHSQCSALPGEASANLRLRLELGPSIGDLIKAHGAGPAPYSYRLPVSHLVPATGTTGDIHPELCGWVGGLFDTYQLQVSDTTSDRTVVAFLCSVWFTYNVEVVQHLI